MRVIGIDDWSPRPGTVMQWTVHAAEPPRPSDVPPSFNQSAHLADTEDGSTWLAAAFDVVGPVDVAALERALAALISRHESLRTGFVRTPDGMSRVVHGRDALRLLRGTDVAVTTSTRAREVLRSASREGCEPFSAPAFTFAAIDRSDTSTVVAAFDHAHVDAYSLAVVIDEIRRVYLGNTVDDPEPGSFVDYCLLESTSAAVRLDDPRVVSWVDFLRARGGAPPQFPLDLGVPPGSTDRCAIRVDTLMSTDEAASFEACCRDEGASLYAGVLSAMAHAVRDLGGGSTLPLLFPLHTRTIDAWRSAVGWFVTNAPLDVVVENDMLATIRRTGPDLRRAVDLGAVPIPRVVEAAGGLERPRKNVFMVSYVDYRRLPGHEEMRAVDAHHISNVTVADDAQFWISRTVEGIALRSRFPDNPTARRTVESFLRVVREHIAACTASLPALAVT